MLAGVTKVHSKLAIELVLSPWCLSSNPHCKEQRRDTKDNETCTC